MKSKRFISTLALTLTFFIWGCNNSHVSVKEGGINQEVYYGRYINFHANFTGSSYFPALAMQVTDLTPIHDRYQAYADLISSYNYAISPLLTDAGGGHFLANPDGNISRTEFFVLLKALLLDNMRFEYELQTINVFECLHSNMRSAIVGATVTDITFVNPAFQSVQCLVDNGFNPTAGFIDGGLVRPNDNLKRGEMITILHKLLSLWLNEIQQIPTSDACLALLPSMYLKSILKTLISNLIFFPNAHAQMTSVTQILDLVPASPYYIATQDLVERYGISNSYVYPDSTARLDQDATYSDVAALILEILNTMVSIAPSYNCPP